jgi:histone acetyltransferase (RNA polymerase elongator complex component)
VLYKQSKFSVPAVGESPERCAHGWVAKGKCIFCGEQIVVIKTEEHLTPSPTSTKVDTESVKAETTRKV